MQENQKRLFFALEVQAPWPDPLPAGRRLEETQRHMTVAFLGQADYSLLQKSLPEIPLLPLKMGVVGIFDHCLFLPERHPHVVAWQVKWEEGKEEIETYQKQLIAWLQELGFNPDVRKEFLPHVTICRAPFNPRPWKKTFKQLPMLTTNLSLFESLGGLHYKPIWSQALLPPFEEIEHTADVAFHIHGTTLENLQLHAKFALAFKFPPLLTQELPTPNSLDDLIIHLNDVVTHLDGKLGCPFKAVSFHGDLQESNGVLKWEMIVDV